MNGIAADDTDTLGRCNFEIDIERSEFEHVPDDFTRTDAARTKNDFIEPVDAGYLIRLIHRTNVIFAEIGFITSYKPHYIGRDLSLFKHRLYPFCFIRMTGNGTFFDLFYIDAK